MAVMFALTLFMASVISTSKADAVKKAGNVALAAEIKVNESNLCTLSRKRWVVQHDVILKLSQTVDASLANDPLTLKRLLKYNEQQEASRKTLLAELGSEDVPC